MGRSRMGPIMASGWVGGELERAYLASHNMQWKPIFWVWWTNYGRKCLWSIRVSFSQTNYYSCRKLSAYSMLCTLRHLRYKLAYGMSSITQKPLFICDLGGNVFVFSALFFSQTNHCCCIVTTYSRSVPFSHLRYTIANGMRSIAQKKTTKTSLIFYTAEFLFLCLYITVIIGYYEILFLCLYTYIFFGKN